MSKGSTGLGPVHIVDALNCTPPRSRVLEPSPAPLFFK